MKMILKIIIIYTIILQSKVILNSYKTFSCTCSFLFPYLCFDLRINCARCPGSKFKQEFQGGWIIIFYFFIKQSLVV